MVVPTIIVALSVAQVQTEAIRSTLETYTEAIRTSDAKTLDRLFHPDYVEVSPLGEVDPREKTLSFYKVPEDHQPPKPESIKIDELTVRYPSATVALAVFRYTVNLKSGDRPVAMGFRVTSCLKREGDRWLLYGVQAAGIRNKK